MSMKYSENGWGFLLAICAGITLLFRFTSSLIPSLQSLLAQAPTVGKVEIYALLALSGVCLVNWFDIKNTKKAQAILEERQIKLLEERVKELQKEIQTAKHEAIEDSRKLINEKTEIIKIELMHTTQLVQKFMDGIEKKFENITEHLIELSGRERTK